MRALICVAFVLGAAGCLRKTEFRCTISSDCSQSGAVCESNNFCGFVDTTCPSGYRFGNLSGDVANQCVGATNDVDAGVDTPRLIDAPPGPGCPSTYAALAGVTGHVYRKIAGNAVWANQKTACSGDGSNAYLAVPDDTTELQALVTAGAVARIWVGIDDQTTEGTYATQRGGTIPANDAMWSTGQPDNQPSSGGGQGDCVAGQMSDARLEDDNCTKTFPAVCECEP